MVALRIHDVRAQLTPPKLNVHGVSASFEVTAPPKLRVHDVQAQLVVLSPPKLRVSDVFAKFAESPVRHIFTGGVWKAAYRHVFTGGAWDGIEPLVDINLDVTSFRDVPWGFAELNGPLIGGRDGLAYKITSTADSGAGTLRDALSAGSRYITFDQAIYGQTITLATVITCNADNITLDGIGANITVSGKTLRFTGTQIVVAGTRHTAAFPGTGEGTDPITFRRNASPTTDQYFGCFGLTIDNVQDPEAADTCIDVIWKRDKNTVGTIAGCLFKNSKRAMLIHSGDTTGLEGTGTVTSTYAVTVAWTRITKCRERLPLARDAHVHLYNNLIDHYGDAATSPTPAQMGNTVDTIAGFTNGMLAENNIAFPNVVGDLDYDGNTVTAPTTSWFRPSGSHDGTPNMNANGTHLKVNGAVTPTETELDPTAVFTPPYSGYPLAVANDALYTFLQTVVGHDKAIRSTLSTASANPWASFGIITNSQVIEVRTEGTQIVTGITLALDATDLGAMTDTGGGVWTKTLASLPAVGTTGSFVATATTAAGTTTSPAYPTIVV